MIPLPGFFGYCDVQMAEAVHSRHPFVLGGERSKEGIARAISCGCHNRSLPALFAGLTCNWAGRQYKNQNLPAGLVSDSNSSPSDVCMPQNAHLPYYLVWARTKYRA